MKFMLLIDLGPRARDFQSLSKDEQRAIAAGYQQLNQTPGVTPGTRLQPPQAATTVRVEDGEAVTSDGPLGTQCAVDGYCFLEADSLEAAVEVASRIPGADMGGAIEVRALVEQ